MYTNRLYDKQFQINKVTFKVRLGRVLFYNKHLVMNDFGGYEEPTSRAFWGSEDLEENPTPDPTFSLEWLTDTPSSIKKLVVIAGDLVTAIAEKHIVHNAKRVCTINSTTEFNVAALFRLTDDLWVCTAKSSVDITSTGELTDTISDIVSQAEIIIAFTDANISKIHGAVHDIVSPTLWRSLSTGKGREDRLSKVPSLEHPNFIAGLAAGVVGYAEMMSLPATMYIMYAADDVYDTETVEPMIKLFSDVTDYAVPKIDHNTKTLNSDKLKLYI